MTEKKFVSKIRSGGDVAVITIPKQIMSYEDMRIGDEVEVSLKVKS